MTARSNRPEIRNPVLRLPAMTKLRALDPSTRAVFRDLLLDLRTDARAHAEKSWRQRKPPMAAYWAAVAVYAGHIARALATVEIPAGTQTKSCPKASYRSFVAEPKALAAVD